MASDHALPTDACVPILGAAVSGMPVVEAVGHDRGIHARAEIGGAETLRFAYLHTAAADLVQLELFPGDTLTQAQALFRDPSRVERLLGLRGSGWEVRPNLHFGFMEKGLTWTRSLVGAEDYAAYWAGRIDSLGAFRREDWESELDELIRAGIFDPADRGQFDRDFTDTGRRTAVPRPGYLLAWQWPLEDAQAAHFPGEVRMALRVALTALGKEHVSFAARRATSPR